MLQYRIKPSHLGLNAFMYVNIYKRKLNHFQLYSSNTFGFFSTTCVALLGFVPGVNLKHLQVCISPSL